MQIWNYPLPNLIGIVFTFIAIFVETIKGGRCTGAWGGEHSCFGGKRSDPSMGTGREPSARNPLAAYFYNQRMRRPANQIQNIERGMNSMNYPYARHEKKKNEPWYQDPSYEQMNGQVDERFEDVPQPYQSEAVPETPATSEEEVMQMWQRLRDRLMDEKAHEVLEELKSYMQEEKTP